MANLLSENAADVPRALLCVGYHAMCVELWPACCYLLPQRNAFEIMCGARVGAAVEKNSHSAMSFFSLSELVVVAPTNATAEAENQTGEARWFTL